MPEVRHMIRCYYCGGEYFPSGNRPSVRADRKPPEGISICPRCGFHNEDTSGRARFLGIRGLPRVKEGKHETADD